MKLPAELVAATLTELRAADLRSRTDREALARAILTDLEHWYDLQVRG